MTEKYSVVNIRSFIDKDDPAYIGEDKLQEILNEFYCPINPDVEHFLLHNAIEEKLPHSRDFSRELGSYKDRKSVV